MRCVVDTVAPRPCGAAFKPDDLLEQARMVEEVDATAVEHGQQMMGVQFGLRLRRDLVGDVAVAEWCTRELTPEPITLDRVDTVALEQCGEFLDHEFGGERGTDFAHGIDDDVVVEVMADGQCHAVAHTPRRVDEGVNRTHPVSVDVRACRH